MYVFLDWWSKNTLECPLYFPKQVSVTSQLDLLIPPLSPKCWITGDYMPTWLLCGFQDLTLVLSWRSKPSLSPALVSL